MISLVEAILDWMDVVTAALIYTQGLPQDYKEALVEKLHITRQAVEKWKETDGRTSTEDPN